MKKKIYRSYKPEIEESRMGVNPFVSGDGFKIEVTRMWGGGYKRDGDGVLLRDEFLVERESRSLVFTQSVNRKLICGMGGAAKDVFLYILYKLEHGKDWIWVNKNLCTSDCGIRANATFEKGVDELIRYGVIYPVYGHERDNVFWINPVFLFNGSRVAKYPRHVDVKFELGSNDKNKNDE